MAYVAVAVFGPTGIGKTSLSLKLAATSGEIVSADSMQVYQYMNIGTAKIGKNEMSGIKHHLIDIISPDKQFTAGDFKRFCENKIPELNKANKIPFIVGGTGFYFSTLINGIANIPQANEEIRSRILTRFHERGQAHMYAMLRKIDPNITERIHENDPQRTCRALEVCFSTAVPLSEHYKKKREKLDVDYLKIGLTMDRTALYERINKRVDSMLEQGLVEEVKSILAMGYEVASPGLSAIGYKETIKYIKGEYSYEKMRDEIQKNSRHYAKRQYTWFRALDNVNWFDVDDEESIENCVSDFIAEKRE